MAWRPYENVIDGELDNTMLGKVTGWLRFCRKDKKSLKVRLVLDGDFHEDIRGCKIRVRNAQPNHRDKTLEGFAQVQRGTAGDITAGLKVNGNYPYTNYPYIEWYSEKNGRVVLELESSQVEVVADNHVSVPPLTQEERQAAQSKRGQAMGEFLAGVADDVEKASGIRPITIVARPRKPKQE